MIVDLYKFIKEQQHFNKLVGNNYLTAEYKCPIDGENFRLWTESHLITFVISGRKDWITPVKTYEIQQGDALFVRRGVYATRQYFEEDHCVLLFFIRDSFIKNFMDENNALVEPKTTEAQADQIFKIDVNDSLQALMFSIVNYLKQGAEIPKSLVEIKFKELLFNIVLNPKNKNLTQFLQSVNQTHQSNLESVMLQNFMYDLDLEAFAKLCGRSLSAFKRDVRSLFNETPGNWLKNKRLEYAKTLLENSDLSVNEVCYESGFKNTSHFNKVFKEKYLLPPNQFRAIQALF